MINFCFTELERCGCAGGGGSPVRSEGPGVSYYLKIVVIGHRVTLMLMDYPNYTD